MTEYKTRFHNQEAEIVLLIRTMATCNNNIKMITGINNFNISSKK